MPLTEKSDGQGHQSADAVIDLSDEGSYISESTLVTEDLEPPVEIPEKRPKLRRALKVPFFSPYRRLVFVVAVINVIILIIGYTAGFSRSITFLGYMSIGNVFIGIMFRNQYVVNLLFTLAILPRTRAPLWLRWSLGKIYHFGGLHSGCNIAGTVYFLVFTVTATVDFVKGKQGISGATLVVTYQLLLLLVAIVIFALPKLRSRFHNTFEATHRFMGWTSLALFWVQTGLSINDGRVTGGVNFIGAAIRSPTPYLLAVITVSISLTWVKLRKVPVTITRPSNHVIIAKFSEGVKTPFAGSASSISLNPLTEWHSFANIANPGKQGFRLVISRAGDWTGQVIDNPPSHFYIKGIATAGVARIETLFNRVLYVATGSGIGPCLPHLFSKDVPAHLFWSTRTPSDTYGDDLLREILVAVPDAVIHDTIKSGKPDMVERAYTLCQKFNCEAVICISNQKLTRKVVYGMESRGIPAFGAIWDS